jgi:hypothetical protein
MAATIEIRSYHGASPDSGTNVAGGSVRFKQADNDTVDANNPIPVPGAGTNYSYVKNLRFYVGATPPSNSVNNLKFYTDGANGLGTGVGLVAKTTASYIDPLANGTSQVGSMSDAFGYTSGSALAVTGSITTETSQAFGNYVHLQMTVGTSASPGTTPSETLTFSYDES